MANNTDIVAKVIASSILLNEERQLLRVRDGAAPVSNQKQPPPSVPVPLANDSKAVAAVLLTLLDERIQVAADEGAAARARHPSVAADTADDGRQTSTLLSARYAENSLAAIPEAPRDTAGFPAAPAPIANPQTNAAPELQSFLQRLAAAAQKSNGAPLAPGLASSLVSRVASGLGPLLAVGAAAALIIWLGVIVAGFLFG